MSEIVQILPHRVALKYRVMPYVAGFAAAAAILAGCNAFIPGSTDLGSYTNSGEYISDEEARAFVREAGADTDSRIVGDYGYPPIEEARKVVLVGVGCGPDKITIVLDDTQDDDFIWECEDVAAHFSEKGA